MTMNEVATNKNMHREVGDHNLAAAGYMFVSVVLYSFLPLVVEVGNTWLYPFYFNAAYQLSASVFLMGNIFRHFRKMGNILPSQEKITFRLCLVTSKRNWKLTGLLAACIVGEIFGFPAYSLSIQHLSTAIAAVSLEISQILTVFLLGVFFWRSGRYQKINFQDLFLLFLALGGFYFVIFAQESSSSINVTGDITTGVVLIIFAIVLNSLLTPISIKHGALLSRIFVDEKHEEFSQIEYTCILVSTAIARLISGVVCFVIAFFYGEPSIEVAFFWGVVSGVFIAGLGGMWGYRALQITSNLGLNAMRYSIPIIAILWLWLFGAPLKFDAGFFVIGTTAIIVANLLINFEASIRLAYRVLILALWACGTVVYLIPGIPITDYYSTIEVASILFVLIMSFRMDRMVRRTTSEENITFDLHRRISALIEKNKSGGEMGKELIKNLLNIDKHKRGDDLKKSYDAMQDILTSLRNIASKGKSKMEFEIRSIEADIDKLAHSKQQGMNFAELLSLGAIGFILVSALLIAGPPGMTLWDAFFVDVISFLLATVSIFLFANIIDLQRDRVNPVLQKTENEHRVFFDCNQP